jgi:predicted nucleic-acid-binding Zn-ribbon protein
MEFEKVTPTCRYGHGDLYRVVHEEIFEGQSDLFGMEMLGSKKQRIFAFNTYTCKVCGYTEVFDDVPSRTAAGAEAVLEKRQSNS